MLREASLVIASNLPGARHALRDLPLVVPLVEMPSVDALLASLQTGDAMLLLEGELASPTAPAQALIRGAVGHGFRVVSVPGPTLPVTALVVSGLPADSFVYLGLLPKESASLRDLLASVACERRTLVVVASGTGSDLWTALLDALGDRPVVVFSGPDLESGVIWRGTLGHGHESVSGPGRPGLQILVIGGAPHRLVRWAEDRLRAEIRARLDQGLDVRQTARQLAAESGWPRRAIYRLAVQAGQPSSDLRR
jgi:16S rRNA (cytidine1402-2'-O)-methyltransferase